MVNEVIRVALIEMRRRDLAVRAALLAAGELDGGYHPRMEAVHRDNAQRLRAMIATVGWPNETIAGVDGAEAAWLVAQHAIGEPAFMRDCRDLVVVEAQGGRVPRWQHAYLDDRVRTFDGRAQRFGTQFELTPEGPVVYEVEDPDRLDERRRSVGLGPMAARLADASTQPCPTLEQFRERREQEEAWRRRVGWSFDDGG